VGTYEDRVDEYAAELMLPVSRVNRVDDELEELMHRIITLIYAAYREQEELIDP
jgi:hypothetical protein